MLQVFLGEVFLLQDNSWREFWNYTGRVAEITARNFWETHVREPAMQYHRMAVHTCPLSCYPIFLCLVRWNKMLQMFTLRSGNFVISKECAFLSISCDIWQTKLPFFFFKNWANDPSVSKYVSCAVKIRFKCATAHSSSSCIYWYSDILGTLILYNCANIVASS